MKNNMLNIAIFMFLNLMTHVFYGNFIISYKQGGTYLYDNSGEEIKCLSSFIKADKIKWSKDRSHSIVSFEPGAVCLYDFNGNEVKCISHLTKAQKIKWAPDGKSFLIFYPLWGVYLYDINGNEIQHISTSIVEKIKWSYDSRTFVIYYSSNHALTSGIYLYNSKGKEIDRISYNKVEKIKVVDSGFIISYLDGGVDFIKERKKTLAAIHSANLIV